jgi:DNA repair protein RadC
MNGAESSAKSLARLSGAKQEKPWQVVKPARAACRSLRAGDYDRGETFCRISGYASIRVIQRDQVFSVRISDSFLPSSPISDASIIVSSLVDGRLARESQQEEFWVVTLNTKNTPIDCHQITVGTLRNSLVHPREVFRPAIRDAANCIIAVHNHPSGDPTPSDQDISVTERLEQTAEVVGIPLIDHIVVGIDKAISIQEWRSGNRW